jgi:hypothetical protein
MYFVYIYNLLLKFINLYFKLFKIPYYFLNWFINYLNKEINFYKLDKFTDKIISYRFILYIYTNLRKIFCIILYYFNN